MRCGPSAPCGTRPRPPSTPRRPSAPPDARTPRAAASCTSAAREAASRPSRGWSPAHRAHLTSTPVRRPRGARPGQRRDRRPARPDGADRGIPPLRAMHKLGVTNRHQLPAAVVTSNRIPVKWLSVLADSLLTGRSRSACLHRLRTRPRRNLYLQGQKPSINGQTTGLSIDDERGSRMITHDAPGGPFLAARTRSEHRSDHPGKPPQMGPLPPSAGPGHGLTLGTLGVYLISVGIRLCVLCPPLSLF